MAGGQCKAGQMRDATQGICAMQVRADALGQAGQMREAKQGRCMRQGRADARGKAE
jgi:hypothetical protein